MTPFAHARPVDTEQAPGLAGPELRYITGSTNLLDPMKGNAIRPRRLIDITGLPLRDIRRTSTGGLLVGILVSNAGPARNPTVEADYLLLVQAILAGASPQLCNMASIDGNLLQRTRYQYFYDTGASCNKREPGSGCPTCSGLNHSYVILGIGERCVAAHPLDLCVVLAALEAQVLVRGHVDERWIALAGFHRLPADTPERDNRLAADELVTAIELPAPRFARHYHHLKVRGRTFYVPALVSVATALEPGGERISELRLAPGDMAHEPWRATELGERFRDHPASRDSCVRSAEALLRDVRSLARNAFRIRLACNAIARALGGAHSGGIGQ